MGISLRKLGNNLVDVFSANTAEDQRKRLAAGKAQHTQPINVGNFRGSGIVEDFLNSPRKMVGGFQDISRGRVKQGVGNVVTGALEGPLGLIPVGRGVQAGLKGAGLGARVASGAKVGLKQGAGFGAAYGGGEAMSQNATPIDIAKSAVISGAIGGVGGGVLGGTIPVATAGAKFGVNRFRTANEIGAVGRDVNKPNVPEVPYYHGGTPLDKNSIAVPTQGVKPALPKVSLKAPTKAEMKIGKNGLPVGLTKELKAEPSKPGTDQYSEMMSELGPNLNADMFTKDNIAKYEKMNAQDLADLSPGEQMAVKKALGAGPPTKEQLAIGMKANPYKSNIHEVQAGNWVAARTAGSAVSDPIMKAGKITDYHLGQLNKENQSLSNGFWDMVEKGTIPKDASLSLQAAAKWFRETANGIHKESNILGTPTRYQKNWELRAASLKEVSPEQLGSGELGSLAKHTIQRKYATHAKFVAAAKKAGLVVEKDPRVALRKYVTATSSALQRKAIAKSLAEADKNNLAKPHTVDLGWGVTAKLSDEGLHQAKGILPMTAKKTKAGTFYDASNSFRKGLLLSVSQFHTVNIAGLRAAPALLMPKPGYLRKGDLTMGVHPVRAGRGLYGTVRAALPGGKDFVNQQLEQAYVRGDIQFAARHGSPLGSTSYGASRHFNLGHETVFGKQLPMMHKEVVGALRRDLEKFGIKEGSPEAMEAGKVANFTMGFINRAAMNMSPTLVKGIERTMLAGQFTPSKLANLYKGATKGSLAGSMARADVAANAISAGALIVGVGWLVRQKSDNVRDMILRALVNPAIPTNIKDKKDNTQEVRIPMTYTAEVAHILGIKLVRQKDGHLGVSFSPKNMPSTIAEWARARLSPNLGDMVKGATNTEFGGKPLYEEGASHGKQAIQIATKTIQGGLPIGIQGLGYTKLVKNRLPTSSREILDAGTPSNNPIIKSGTASVGFTLRTDKTVGKSLENNRYFDAVSKNAKGLDRQSRDAYDLWTGSKKNSVTGKYDVQPSYYDPSAKALALLQNPKALNAIYELNQGLKSEGQQIDPLWQLPKDQVKNYLNYQHMAPGSADKTDWVNKNPWYYGDPKDKADTGVAGLRNEFFDSLPEADPNKPKLDLQYPEPSRQVGVLMDQYSNISDSKQKGAFLDAHPEVIKQWNAQANYTNKLRENLGYAPFKNYPEPTAQLQGFMDKYSAADKSTRKGIRNANPQAYQNMIAYFDSLDLYNINKEGALNQLQGEPDQTSKQNKAIFNLAKDIYQNPDGTYSIVPAGWMQGLSNGGGGFGSGKKATGSIYQYAISPNAAGTPSRPKVTVRKSKRPKATKKQIALPKVTIRKSRV